MKRAVILVVAVLVLFGWIFLRHPSRASKAELRPAPDFSIPDVSGRPLTLSQFRGKVILLDFWATWCEPCKIEIPHFVAMQEQLGGQGLQVIGISMDDDEEPVHEFQRQYGINYPIAMGTTKLAQSYGGILGLPITFVIDRQGRIFSRHVGQTQPSLFDSEVQQLLRTP